MKSLFLLLIFTVFTHVNTFAQTAPLYLDQYPKQLKAEEDVFFTLKSTEDFSLETTNIVWKIDGTIFDQGVGRTTFKTKTPKQNIQKTISATVEIPGQSPVFVSLPLRASPFILLYEGSQSVVPTFYKGRRLPGKEGSVRMGIIGASRGYTTDFTVNSTKASTQNGVTITNSRLTEKILNVFANIRQSDNVLAQVEKTIPLQQPEIHLFRENKVSGLQLPILGSENGGEIYVSVEPYFFSGENKYDKIMRFVWRLNNEVKNVTEPWFVKLTSNNKENLQVKVEVSQSEKITQRAEKLFTAIFN